MNNSHNILPNFTPHKDFFVGIDSDGCVFDSMEIKQREAVYPNILNFWNLQAVAPQVWDVIAFANLYSTSRGVSRFPALINVMNLLREHPAIREHGIAVPDLTPLTVWLEQTVERSNAALRHYAEQTHDSQLITVYQWSCAIDESVKKITQKISTFPFVRESLIKLTEHADALVVSQTTMTSLTREWREHRLEQYVRFIAGQEHGTKIEHLKYAAVGKYSASKILLIGDAPGDCDAAQRTGILFYPIIPGKEARAWERFYHEGLGKFFAGIYAGTYQTALIEEFQTCLPEIPPWKNKDKYATETQRRRE